MNAQDIKKLIESNEDVQLIDVRTHIEHITNGLSNSINIDVNNLNAFKKQVSNLNKDKQYITYCRSGARSQTAADIMTQLGLEVISSIDGAEKLSKIL